jgi:outer membrane protein assembly factor BamB
MIDGKTAIITLGADHATAHRAADGKLLWSHGGFNPGKEQYFRTIASPVLAGDLVLCPYARGATLTALRTGGEDGGRQAWRLELGADVPTPAVTGDRVYLCGDKGLVSCLEASTGKIVWQEALPKSRHDFSSSPVIAGDHVYLTREDGTTFVIRHADSFDLVATNSVASATVATPVFAHGRIFLRTYDAILCISP